MVGRRLRYVTAPRQPPAPPHGDPFPFTFVLFWTAFNNDGPKLRPRDYALTPSPPLPPLPTHSHPSSILSCLPPRRRLRDFADAEADLPTTGRPTRSRDSDEGLAVSPASKRARTARQRGAGAGDEGSAGEGGSRGTGGGKQDEGADEDGVEGGRDASGGGAHSE